MPQVARIGDQWAGTCKDHGGVTGVIITGSSDHFSGGKGVARVGDTVQASCGHTDTIASGSSTNFTNGDNKAYIGSATTGSQLTGTVITGNTTHITG